MESIIKSRIQGVWDPAHSTQLPPHYTRLPPLSTRMYHSEIMLPPHSIRPPQFHSEFCCHRSFHPDVSLRNSNAGWERRVLEFSGYTYPDPLIALTPREFRSHFAQVPRCFPEASRYVRPTSLDIFL